LRIEDDYKTDEIASKMKEAGFKPRRSTVVCPKEAQASGKPHGKPGWKRAEHFEHSAGERIDVWHDEPTALAQPEINERATTKLGVSKRPLFGN